MHVTCLSLHSARNGELVQYWILSAHKVLPYIEYRAVSGVFRTIDHPPPLHPASVSSPRTKGGGVHSATHSPGGEGVGVGVQYFGRRQTLDCVSTCHVYSFLDMKCCISWACKKNLIALYYQNFDNKTKGRTNRHAICACATPESLARSMLVSNSAESHSLTSDIMLGIL